MKSEASPPGYYFRPGTGGGKSKWHIYLPHGGWCFSPDECLRRSRTASGSSTFFPAEPTNANLSPDFKGILSSNSSINPHFHNWNLVRLIYCDGGGYAGTAGRLDVGNGTAIYLDGWKIVQAVIQDLKSTRGIRSADQILLVGSSAGGQAAVALCDRIAGAFPWAATKCVSDSGFFIDSKDREGGNTWRAKAQRLIDLHKPNWPACMHALPETDHWKCFFPQYILRDVATPLFLFRAFFDINANMLGGLLPNNQTYANDCLHEVSWAPMRMIKRKEWGRVEWKTNRCTAGERHALFSAASVLHDELVRVIRTGNTVAAFVRPGMLHVALCYNWWTNVTIRGVSVESAIVQWLGNKMPKRFVHI
ncbi:unnamed protein product [Closterium sp. Yama58-4]|nr:unnamed protein product [Closterium sp. Yama58-4]